MTDPVVTLGSFQLDRTDIQAGSYTVEQNPLAASAERNMAGTLVEQFLGYFPSVKFKTMPMSSADAHTLLDILSTRNISVTYFDIYTNANQTITMYPAPIATTALLDCMTDGLDVTLIAIVAAGYY